MAEPPEEPAVPVTLPVDPMLPPALPDVLMLLPDGLEVLEPPLPGLRLPERDFVPVLLPPVPLLDMLPALAPAPDDVGPDDGMAVIELPVD